MKRLLLMCRSPVSQRGQRLNWVFRATMNILTGMMALTMKMAGFPFCVTMKLTMQTRTLKWTRPINLVVKVDGDGNNSLSNSEEVDDDKLVSIGNTANVAERSD